MRTVILLLLVVGCKDKPESKVDASVSSQIDAAKPIDAAIDAPPDAPPDATSMSVMAACMHACDALLMCFGSGDDPAECYEECATDLADCSAQQVMQIDQCSTLACGDKDASPIVECIMAVQCVEMALTNSRK